MYDDSEKIFRRSLGIIPCWKYLVCVQVQFLNLRSMKKSFFFFKMVDFFVTHCRKVPKLRQTYTRLILVHISYRDLYFFVIKNLYVQLTCSSENQCAQQGGCCVWARMMSLESGERAQTKVRKMPAIPSSLCCFCCRFWKAMEFYVAPCAPYWKQILISSFQFSASVY